MEKDYLEKEYISTPMYAFISNGYFIDIGIPSDFARANVEFRSFK
jgi:D-glycero-alpha-D-manno-heptose 1-phosphate guanylyltransferase